MHLVDEAQAEAQAAIGVMRRAALHARRLHARAELLRHMRTTAGKPGAQPETVAREWMQAWNMQDWPQVADEMRRFAAAFCAYAAHPDDANDAAIRVATVGLEQALEDRGTTLADEMAWRSECAHGWWAAVSPPPVSHPPRNSVPGPAQPFWVSGCAPHCGGEQTVAD